MRRGGSTLQFQLVGDILDAASVVNERRWVGKLQDADLKALLEQDAVVHVLKTHSPMSGDESILADGRIRILYICRDPRDGLVSYLHKYSDPFTTTRAKRILDTIASEFEFWTRAMPAVYSRYESVVGDMPAEILRIAHALRIPVSEHSISEICSRRSLASQRERIEAFEWDRFGIRNGMDVVDPASLLHSNHVNKGTVEGWRETMTRRQIAFVETIHGNLIERMGYEISTGPFALWIFHCRRRLSSFVEV